MQDQDHPRPGWALKVALDTLQALGDRGLTAVPLEPTATMLAAGSRAGGVDVETAWRIYQAMIHEMG